MKIIIKKIEKKTNQKQHYQRHDEISACVYYWRLWSAGDISGEQTEGGRGRWSCRLRAGRDQMLESSPEKLPLELWSRTKKFVPQRSCFGSMVQASKVTLTAAECAGRTAVRVWVKQTEHHVGFKSDNSVQDATKVFQSSDGAIIVGPRLSYSPTFLVRYK